jgi:branched-chain amino acid transport system permease protein
LTKRSSLTGTQYVKPMSPWIVIRDLVILAACFVALIPLLAIHRVTEFMIFCVFAMSFDLLYGYMGRLSFGHVLYLGTGVYGATLFSVYVNTNPFLAMSVGILSAAILAAILGLIVVNLQEASFALTNLAFNQVGFFLIGSAFQKVTHGEDGLSAGVMPWGFVNFSNEKFAFVAVLVCLLLTFLFLKVLTTSPYGIIIRSIKENENRVKFLGYDTFFYKWLTFIISATVAGLAGTLYTLYVQFVSPTFIHPLRNVEPIFAVLIGGAGNLYGAIIGGIVFMTMRDWLSTHVPQWEWILGGLLLIIVFWLRRGLTGFFKMTIARVRGT